MDCGGICLADNSTDQYLKLWKLLVLLSTKNRSRKEVIDTPMFMTWNTAK